MGGNLASYIQSNMYTNMYTIIFQNLKNFLCDLGLT